MDPYDILQQYGYSNAQHVPPSSNEYYDTPSNGPGFHAAPYSPPNYVAPIRGTFQNDIFVTRYQRNNKKRGLKNLRCFPSCGFRHKERGFCGRSLEIEVNHESNVNTRNLRCWVEFVKKGDPSPVRAGDKVDTSWVLGKERNKDEPMRPWVLGERVDEKCDEKISIFEFNKERKGWHYSWTSNKHTCNAEHCLQCYVFQTTAYDQRVLECIDVFQSPHFMLFCRRRRRFLLPPSAPLSVENKRAVEWEDDGGPALKREKLEDDEDDDDDDELPEPPPKVTKHNDTSNLDVVMRRLAVIMARIQQLYPPEESNRPRKQSDVSDNEDISSHLFDALEMFTTTEGFPDNQLFEGLDSIESFEPTAVTTRRTSIHSDGFKPPALERTTSELLIDDIATYLRNDLSFKRSVEQQTRLSVPDYHGFLHVAQEHLESYRRTRNISRAEFNKIFNRAVNSHPTTSAAIVPPKQPSLFGRIASLVSSSSNAPSTLNEPQPMLLQGPGNILVPNIQGSWRQTEESEQRMQDFRNKMGTPWILSKMFEFMESKFTITLNGLEMATTLNRAWISNTLRFQLDGEEHHWGISLPGPFSQLSRGWKYRSWIDNNKIIVSHMIGDQRLTRINWVNKERTVLNWTVLVEIVDANTGYYSEVGRVHQQALAE